MSLPRPGGGLPLYSVMDGGSQGFAPPRRGSTCISLTIVTMSNVCPAQAGVYLQGLWLSPGIPRLPRPGGGLPLSELSLFWISAFAPPRRGSTVGAHGDGATIIVCPAQAGVYRLSVGVSIGICGLPRPGGGLPLSELSLFWISAFAPPRRGSTVHSAVPSRGRGVCPAQAGVYLTGRMLKQIGASLPRPGGGLPSRVESVAPPFAFAPPRRGSTRDRELVNGLRTVCPAQAGEPSADHAGEGSDEVYPRVGRLSHCFRKEESKNHRPTKGSRTKTPKPRRFAEVFSCPEQISEVQADSIEREEIFGRGKMK